MKATNLNDSVMLYSASLELNNKIIKEHIYIGVTNNLERRTIEHNNRTKNSRSVSPGIAKLHAEYPDAHVVLKPLLSRNVKRDIALDAESYLIDRYQPSCNRQISALRVEKFIEKTFNKMYKNFLKASPSLTKDITE